MKLTQRQDRLLTTLQNQPEAMSGTDLATLCGVTRQVVVHDVALLRAAGIDILSTPRGYRLPAPNSPHSSSVLSVFHAPELTETELYVLVDHGIQVKDVLIEHPLYGELRGTLHLASRRDVDLFLERLTTSEAALLSSLTDGYHLHSIEYSSRQRLREAITALRSHGIEVFDE